MQEIVKEINDFDTLCPYLIRDDMYNITSSSLNNLKNLFNYLYNSSTYFLSRKYNKFNHHVNTEVTQLITEYRNA
jgi:hypothetical protein